MPDFPVKPDNNDVTNALLPYLPSPSANSSHVNFFDTSFPLRFPLISGATAATPAGTTYKYFALGRNLNAIQVSVSAGTFSATVLIEGTLDGVNWNTVQSITAAGITQLAGLYHSLRVSISAYTSGTINVTALSQRS